MRTQRRAAVGEAEHALEADREVEVATGVEPALGERLHAGELAAAQAQPGVRVGPDDDVGTAARDAGADAGAVGGTADLPGVPDVPEAQVIGRVEVPILSEVAVGQRAKCVLHLRKG